ncbi:MAG: DUF4276 family protein [Bacteroides sp.]
MRLVIVCEGQTEQEFVKKVLSPAVRGLDVEAPLIKKSKGGIVAWEVLKKQLVMHCHEGAPFVTTLIDFYGIKDHHHFPRWEEGKTISDKEARVEFLEKAMKEDLAEDDRYLFYPYLQLHEFESLLFSNQDALFSLFETKDIRDRKALQDVFSQFPNPELINDSPLISPSQRLASAIIEYDKVLYGPLLAEAIGLSSMIERCPHFAQWVATLQEIAQREGGE